MASKEVALSYLQFVGDAVFFCYGKEESFLILNHVLRFFEAILGLKINRNKCKILGLIVIW